MTRVGIPPCRQSSLRFIGLHDFLVSYPVMQGQLIVDNGWGTVASADLLPPESHWATSGPMTNEIRFRCDTRAKWA
jgi:hypothetical protein